LATNYNSTTNFEDFTKTCKLRSRFVLNSSDFEISSHLPASIKIARNASRVNFAGTAFYLQPVCEVRDLYGNLVSGSFPVQASVKNSGGGCLCNVEAGVCKNALESITVQKCDGACSAIQLEHNLNSQGWAVTEDGFARFRNLACTRASCIPECFNGHCDQSVCIDPYQLTCTISAGLCNPCTATSEVFDVFPDVIDKLIPDKIYIVIAGSQHRGISDSGFYRQKILNFSNNIAEAAKSLENVSISDLERCEIKNDRPNKSSQLYIYFQLLL
jgi:hypothetical protein